MLYQFISSVINTISLYFKYLNCNCNLYTNKLTIDSKVVGDEALYR